MRLIAVTAYDQQGNCVFQILHENSPINDPCGWDTSMKCDKQGMWKPDASCTYIKLLHSITQCSLRSRDTDILKKTEMLSKCYG